MTWQESAAKAVQRLVSRTGNPLFTRRQLIDSEIKQIIAETASAGETPDQTLSRVLQELRDQEVIKFEASGVYRLLKIVAKAYPRKNFFVQMFTKDISLEDCVLDLIDNSVDGFIKSRHLRLSEVASVFWDKKETKKRTSELPEIHVSLSDTKFEIRDNCGGIDFKDAQNEVFNFGHSTGWTSESLGVYGIGLKRALFKLGNHFEVYSQTTKNGFSCELDVDVWVEKDNSIDDWTFPLKEERAEPSFAKAGTRIRVNRLHDEVKMRMKTGTVESSLRKSISTTFSFFLNRYVKIFVNNQMVEPTPIPTSRPSKGTVSFERFPDDGVEIRILATLAKTGADGRYDQTQTGWYVICNGRAVLTADKGEITGWGIPPMPAYHTQYGGFIGLVFFESVNPMKMPWTTTKRSLNRESAIYLRTRGKMALAARPVLAFMRSKYSADYDTAPVERELARNTVGATPAQLATAKTVQFEVIKTAPPPNPTTRVQYYALNSDLEKIRKHLNKSRMSAVAIGEHTLNYFMEQEGLK